MNVIKNISKKAVGTVLPLTLGTVGVIAGSVATLRANDYSEVKKEFLASQANYSDMLKKIDRIEKNVWNNQHLTKGLNNLHKEEFKKLGDSNKELSKFIKDENQKHWDIHFKKELANQEILEGLTAQIRAILDTKTSKQDLLDAQQKIESILKENKIDQATFKSWLEDNLGSISTQIKDLVNETRIDKNDISLEIDALRDEIRAILDTKNLEIILSPISEKIENITGQQSEHTDQLKELKENLSKGLVDLEKEMWILSDDLGLYSEDLKTEQFKQFKTLRRKLGQTARRLKLRLLKAITESKA